MSIYVGKFNNIILVNLNFNEFNKTYLSSEYNIVYTPQHVNLFKYHVKMRIGIVLGNSVNRTTHSSDKETICFSALGICRFNSYQFIFFLLLLFI